MLFTIGYEPPCSPLMLAAWIGDAFLIEFLARDLGQDLEFRDADDRTALTRACSCNHYDAVQTLINLGCNVNVADSYGQTPIGLCAQFGYRRLQKLVASHWNWVDPKSKGIFIGEKLRQKLMTLELCLRRFGLRRGEEEKQRDEVFLSSFVLFSVEDDRLCVVRAVLAQETDFF